MPQSGARWVSPFHTVCTRHPETIHASGKARRSNSSDIAALTGLRNAAARNSDWFIGSLVGWANRSVPTILVSNEDGGYGAKRALPTLRFHRSNRLLRSQRAPLPAQQRLYGGAL